MYKISWHCRSNILAAEQLWDWYFNKETFCFSSNWETTKSKKTITFTLEIFRALFVKHLLELYLCSISRKFKKCRLYQLFIKLSKCIYKIGTTQIWEKLRAECKKIKLAIFSGFQKRCERTANRDWKCWQFLENLEKSNSSHVCCL